MSILITPGGIVVIKLKFALLSLLMAWSWLGISAVDLTDIGSKSILPYKEGRLLVKLKEQFSVKSVIKVADSIGARPTSAYSLIKGLYIYEFSEHIDLEEARLAFLSNDAVEYAEPDYYYHIMVQNDPRYSEQWALENNAQTGGTANADINAESMWNIQQGDQKVVIGVIDTGIDYNHQDLASNLWINTKEVANNGIDDDNNGYIDDIYGINAILNNGNPYDDNMHGTHVSGTIGADGNNSIGVVGVTQNVQIAACKFLSAQGSGSISDAIKCMDYFARLKKAGVNIVATNNSWGGGSRSQAMEDAIKAHRDLDILFIAAAGNESNNNDSYASYPATYQIANVISVAATDSSDGLASFSNYGLKTVHVAAPGVKILSTVPNNAYSSLSGTSMATPHVTGLAAIIKSNFPAYDYKQIKNLIISSGTPIPSVKNKTISGRRIRGADSNGTGALTCQNQLVKVPLQPANTSYNVPVGSPLFLAAININCQLPVGPITLYQDATQSVILKDDGTSGDTLENDGLFSLNWIPTTPGTYPLDFGNNYIVTVTVYDNALKNYTVDNSISYTYDEFAGNRLNAQDETLSSVISPFPIKFGDSKSGFNTLYVSSNGTISFSDNINPGYKNLTLPNVAQETLISLYWDDLINSTSVNGSDIYYDTLGISPNRKFVVEWWNMKNYNAPGVGIFQVIFYENSSDVRFNFQDTDFGNALYSFGKSATVGVQTGSTQAKLYSFNTASVPSKTSLLFKIAQ